MNVIGIVGWKNSGKTTLAAALIRELSGRGLTVSSIKHAHHMVDVDQPGTDSYKHREAGAKIEVHRQESGRSPLYREDANIIAVASDYAADFSGPLFDINDVTGIADFIIDHVQPPARES